MLRAAKQGYRLYETGFWPVNYGQKNIQHPSKKPNPVKARIVILSNASCGSMCYQFTRTLLTLPGTVLVGQAPNTMDRLTNPVAVPLASHKAILYLGTREMISPGYAFGHALIPSFRYEGNLSNTPAVKQWILRLYKRKKI